MKHLPLSGEPIVPTYTADQLPDGSVVVEQRTARQSDVRVKGADGQLAARGTYYSDAVYGIAAKAAPGRPIFTGLGDGRYVRWSAPAPAPDVGLFGDEVAHAAAAGADPFEGRRTAYNPNGWRTDKHGNPITYWAAHRPTRA